MDSHELMLSRRVRNACTIATTIQMRYGQVSLVVAFSPFFTDQCQGADPVAWRFQTGPKSSWLRKHTLTVPLKPALSVGFCTFEGRSSVSAKAMRRCME